MKKLIAMLLALVMVLSMAACGASEPAPTEAPKAETPKVEAPAESADGNEDENKVWFGTEDGKTVTLRFWAAIQPEYGYSKIVENFNAEYADKGVQVEFVRYNNNTDGNLQLETQLMAGDGIDVFIGYSNKSKLMSRADSGLLYDYSDYLESVGFDVATELGANAAVEYVLEDGTIWGLPTKFDNRGWMTINKTAFEEAGIEIPYDGWTYAEFLDACEKLTTGEGQNKRYGIVWGFSQDFDQPQSYIGATLGINDLFADASLTKANFDNEVYIQGLEMIKKTMDEGWGMTIADDVADQITFQTSFLAGKCAMHASYSQLRLCMDTENYPHDFVTALVPFPVPSEEYADVMDFAHKSNSGDFISVSAKTPYPEAAAEFARWYIQGGMTPLILAARYPLWTGLSTEQILDVITQYANGTVDLDSLEHLFSLDRNTLRESSYVSNKSSALTDILWEEFQNYLYGKTATAEEAMKTAQTRADAELAQ